MLRNFEQFRRSNVIQFLCSKHKDFKLHIENAQYSETLDFVLDNINFLRQNIDLVIDFNSQLPNVCFSNQMEIVSSNSRRIFKAKIKI